MSYEGKRKGPTWNPFRLPAREEEVKKKARGLAAGLMQ
jgi:hypothetical protein